MSTFINVFRATSGSGVVYFNENQAEPPGITNKVVIAQKIVDDPVQVGSGSQVLWKWNGTDLDQFDLDPVVSQGMTATLEVITSSYSPTSKSLLLSGSVASATAGDHIVFLVTSSLPTTRYILEMTIRSVNDAGGTTHAGPVMLASGSDSTFLGVGIFQANDGITSLAIPLWQTGALDDTYTSVTNTTGITPMVMAIGVRGGEVISGAYSFVIQPRSKPEFGFKFSGIRSYNGWNPLLASWNTSTLGRFGIGIRCGSTVTDPKIIIDSFVIRTDPYVM